MVHATRRQFITLLGGMPAAWPLTAVSQRKMLRIGVVSVIIPRSAPFWIAFDQRMRELGYVEGQSLEVEFIGLDGQIDRMAEGMKELVRRKVDVIIASGVEAAVKSALAATATIPIVMIAVDYDPFARGYVRSLARPGGNATGLFFQQIELTVKRLQLLKDAFPDIAVATIFWDAISVDQWRAAQDAQAGLGLRLTGIELREPPYDYERALDQAPPDHRGALIVLASPVMFPDRVQLAQMALRRRVITMFVFKEYAAAGGLMSYGPSLPALYRRAAEYVDRIAKGTPPADLPIEQPTKFELVVNLKTAKAIGVEVPTSILLRADEVIE
jgi:putative tryptophan/tyrosine transport system substrate-binding protein